MRHLATTRSGRDVSDANHLTDPPGDHLGRAALPSFRVGSRQSFVPSYRQATWDGIRRGDIGPDSMHMHVVYRVLERLDPEAMNRAFEELVGRHEVLRVTVHEREGRPWLSYTGERVARMERVDLTSMSEQRSRTEAFRIASHRVWEPFDLAVGPLFRGFLISIGPAEHVLGIVLHHFIGDGLSLDILCEELGESYESNRQGKPRSSRDLEPQYKDYLLGLANWMSGPVAQAQLARSTSELTNAFPILPPEHGVFRAAPTPAPRESIAFSSDLSSAVSRLALHLRTTKFVVLLAAQKVALAHLTDQEDITVGSVVNGRELPELRRMVGYMADRVYYRTDLTGDPTFEEAAHRVHSAVLGAARRQLIRSDIVRESLLRVGRTLVAPIFNYNPARTRAHARSVNRGWQRFPVAPSNFSTGPSAGMRYWMTLSETPEGLSGDIKYNGRAVNALARGLGCVLRKATADCGLRLSQLSLQD